MNIELTHLKGKNMAQAHYENRLAGQELPPACVWRVVQMLGNKKNATPNQKFVPGRVAAMNRAL